MIFSTCNQYSIKGIFLILLLMISTTFIQAQKADLSFSIHLKKANLKEFIFEIEKASGYSFIYGEEIIFKHPQSKKSSIKPDFTESLCRTEYQFQNKQKSHYIKKIRSTIQQEVFYPKRVCIGQYIERNIDRCQYL